MLGTEQILRPVLDQWKNGIDAHDPALVAEVFADQAIFQGLRPYSVGPQGVYDYYDAQPQGMTVEYRILESRRLTSDVALGYLDAEFSYRDRDPVKLHIGVVVTRTSKDWRIASYQASPVPA
ncbi:nuclear transport factor 2 family protein [Mycobacterium sp. NPDC051804]|uniref:nuclear transport factor 2 family protein n=1 Tax=Mycobacterium sp. NPDC051804 TaxID=3364295 RepID=UPI0037941E9B